MNQYAIVFPGQGSQSVGMLDELHANHQIVKDTFSEASNALGYDLWELVANGPVEKLNQTQNTQPAMLASGVAVWRLLDESGISSPLVLAGHSLGEYTALVCANSLAFSDAIKLVEARGKLMQEAVPDGQGGMAAILGLDDDKVREVCASASSGEVVEAVNFNSPGQVVIAGQLSAVQRAMDLAKAAGAKRALALPVSAPSHCALMQPAAELLAEKLQQIQINAPAIPVIHNVTVSSSADPQEIAKLLKQQLFSPVRWVETIQSVRQDYGVETVIEAGPGKVLTGLCKRIDKAVTGMGVFDQKSLDTVLEKNNA